MESFNPSYEIDTKVGGYTDYLCIEKNGETYYVPLTVSNNDNNQITYKGLYPSNGRYSDETDKGGYYALVPTTYYRNINNGWKFSFEMDNRGNRMPKELLDDTIKRNNSVCKSGNVVIVPKVMKNYIIFGEFDDSYSGLTINESNRVVVQLNVPNLQASYGEYNSDPTSNEYKSYLSVACHEMGHATYGFQDNASHLPSLYSYRRNHIKATYNQANDIKWLRYAYTEKGNDDSLFDSEPRELNLEEEKIETANNSIDYNFDFISFDTISDKENFADNIIKGKLSFKEVRNIDLGKDDYIYTMTYKIYDINIINQEKGILKNTELKIPKSIDLNINEDQEYRIYLKQYNKIPCSLVNMTDSLIEIS